MAVRFGRRVRKGIAVTAVAAAAMVALTASQAPGLVVGAAHRPATPSVPPGPPIDGGGPYIVNLPPLGASGTPSGQQGAPGSPVVGTGGGGIPTTVLLAYQRAEAALRGSNPGCNLPWQLLAGIGQVESGQAENGNVDAQGNALKPILGPVLSGGAFADIPDTDNGRYDGDPVHDRAVGPMQFIPSTWATWGADGNHDGVKNPENVFDAALAAGDYLCAVGGNLATPANMARAILGYNHSTAYLKTVESWYEYFLKGVHEVPDNSLGSGVTAPTPSTSPTPKRSSTPSGSPLPTVSVSGSIGPAPSGSPSTSPSGSPTCPTTPPPSTTPPATGTPSAPPSGSGTPTSTPSDPCASSTPTTPPTATPTPSESAKPTVTPTVTPSTSAGTSASASATASASTSASGSTSASAPAG